MTVKDGIKFGIGFVIGVSIVGAFSNMITKAGNKEDSKETEE